jgi:hypothetical protein
VTRPVGPNDTYPFEFDVTAPAPGNYLYAFMMYQSAALDSYFFSACQRDVEVLGTDVDMAEVVSHTLGDMVNDTDNVFHVVIRNTGTSTWTRAGGYVLRQASPGESFWWDPARAELDPSDVILPGQVKDFAFVIHPLDLVGRQYFLQMAFGRPVPTLTAAGAWSTIR